MVWVKNFGLALYFYARDGTFLGCEFTEKWVKAMQSCGYDMKKWLKSIGDKLFWW